MPSTTAEPMAEKSTEILPLTPSVQHDLWGSPGAKSLAGRIVAHNGNTAVAGDSVYSSICVGTHRLMRTVLAHDPSTSLLEYIRTEVIEVDSSKVEHYARLHKHGLPFLLQLVSVGSPQSIHVHPDTLESEKLHERNPARYPDITGKAEMAIALSTVDALFGFRSASEIVVELARVPEFADAVGRLATDQFVKVVKTGRAGPDDLRKLFSSFMKAEANKVEDCLRAVVDRFTRMPRRNLSSDDTLLLSLYERFPKDAMCFSVYFFNRVKLEPGTAVFIHPKEPHAYLAGDLIEVSSCSVNVARAGFSTKELDKEEFVNLLNYDDSPVEVSKGEAKGDFVTDFLPPVDEFQLSKYMLPAGKVLELKVAMAPSIVACLSGEGFIHVANDEKKMIPIRVGSVHYLRAGSRFILTASDPLIGKSAGNLVAVRVGINESVTPEGNCVIS